MTITAEGAVDTEEAAVQDRVAQLLAEQDPATTEPARLWGAQFDLGLAWVHYPEGLGGLGVRRSLQEQVDRPLREAGFPINWLRNPIGLGMGAPTILTHGSLEQQQRWLRPMFTCEEIWCQMFSEPGAGSDVASLAARAVPDGDEWVVNGQKVWTTLAHVSRWGLLVARTDPDQPKHRGLTYFVVDMHAPGVEVRPLRQMTGEAEFNEVYFTDARVPDSQRLGGVGEGWNVAITTLMNERVSIGGNVTPRGSGPIGEAVRIWRERGLTDPVKRDQLMRLWVEAEAFRLTNLRAAQLRRAGTPGPEGSVAKLAYAELNKRIYECCVDLLGADGMRYGSYEMVRPDQAGLGWGREVQKSFIRARANSIEGGTSEIMKNILGERVLGLPGEPRADKGRPWSEVPRG
ncbi:MAG TPA: acyl-CoA dehydrogenase family protein [Acidimicrobiales bacterium]|nr:acyl-CoA dehydrogenase family protein [Acidimicrobiales bacterium]